MKYIVRLLSAVLALLLLTGCSSTGYRYSVKGDEVYISLAVKRGSAGESEDFAMQAAVGITFASFDEMREDIKLGRYTDEEWKQLARFPKDAKGKIVAPNMEVLPDPTYPEKFELDKVYWSGYSHYPSFQLKTDGAIGFVESYSKERMADELDRIHIKPKSGKYGIEAVEPVPNANGKVSGVAYYFTALNDEKTKRICYHFSVGDITYYVSEVYSLDADAALKWISIDYTSEERYFNAYIYPLEDNIPLFQLSIEEISQFGFKK